MERRSFLQTMAVSGLLAGLPGFWAAPGSPDWHRYGRPGLLDLLDDPASVHEIGRAYRERVPEHNDAATLGRLLQAALPHPPTGGHAPPEHLARHVQADFAEGRIVQLKGWILSVTEARQCALYSLLYA